MHDISVILLSFDILNGRGLLSCDKITALIDGSGVILDMLPLVTACLPKTISTEKSSLYCNGKEINIS